MTDINVDEIKNKPGNEITEAEFDAVLEAIQEENPGVSIEVRGKQDNARAAVRMTSNHSGPDNAVDHPSIGLAGIINRARSEQIRARIASGELGADLDHVGVADEGSGNKAILRIANNAAGKAFRDALDPTSRLNRLPKPSQKNAIEFAVELHDAEQMAAYVDQQLAHLRDERQRLVEEACRLVKEGMGEGLANVSVAMGREVIAVEFQPVQKALDTVRTIDGAKFRKGDKKNDVLDRPHWIVPVDQVTKLEAALPKIDAAVREANAEHDQAREAGREIAQRIQGQHGPVVVEHDEDKDALMVFFAKDEDANDEVRRAGGRFDRERTAWRVPLDKAEALEERLPEIQELVETAQKREREAAEARAQEEADRKARQAAFKQKKDVVMANIDQPSGADRDFMEKMARVVKKNGIVKAENVHAYRSLVSDYPDYVEAEGLPIDVRNNNARWDYQDGKRAREAEAFVAEKYTELQNANTSNPNESL